MDHFRKAVKFRFLRKGQSKWELSVAKTSLQTSMAFRSTPIRKRPSLSEEKVSRPGRGRVERTDPLQHRPGAREGPHGPLKMRMGRTITPSSKRKGEKKTALEPEKWQLCLELQVNTTF